MNDAKLLHALVHDGLADSMANRASYKMWFQDDWPDVTTKPDMEVSELEVIDQGYELSDTQGIVWFYGTSGMIDQEKRTVWIQSPDGQQLEDFRVSCETNYTVW